jgi:hypothetical protein
LFSTRTGSFSLALQPLKKTAMRYILLSILISLSSFICQAQITGSISDGSTLEPVSGAMVLIMKVNESSPVANSKSDEKGDFKLDATLDPTLSYKLLVKMVGYEEYSAKVNPNRKSQKFKVDLERNQKMLKEVNVSGTRARALIKGEDTIEYDAKAFKVNKDANAEDLVAKMPGITRDASGIKSNGETVQKVLVDGQEFFGEDANIALKNLPAETIDKVEVIDALNDRSSFTGFNDGNTIKTMNLKTKMGKSKGYFGKVYGGYGTNSRYQGGGNINTYEGSKRISVLGMINNINNLNFSTSELVGAATGSSGMGGAGGAQMMRGMSFGMSVAGSGRGGGFGGPMSNFTVSNQNGVNDAASLGVNYNDVLGKNKNVKISTSYFGNRTDNLTISESRGRNLIDTLNTLSSNIDNRNTSTGFAHRFNARIEGNLDAKNSYVWSNRLNLNESNSQQNSSTINFFKEGVNAFENNNLINSSSKTLSYNSNFLYKYKFEKKGRTLSLNSILDLSDQKGLSVQDISNVRSGLSQNFGLDYNTRQWSSTITNIISFTEPSGKYGQWLVNYSPSISNRRNVRDVSTFNSLNPEPVLADSLTNHFTNNIFYNIGGLSYRLQFSKLRLMFGSSVQNISFDGRQTYPTGSELKRDFFGVLPYFNVQFSPQKMTKLKLSYNTTMNVPSVSNIQPVVDLSNPNMIYRGNENLVNEYNHNLFFHYMKPNIVKGTFFIVVSNISYTNNRIANFTYSAINDTAIDGVQLRRGVQYSKNVNMDNAFSSFLFGNYTMPIKPLKSNFTINGNFSYNQNPSMVNFTEAMTKTYMYSIGTMLASSTMENIDYSLSYNPKYFNNTFDLPNVADNNFWIHTAAANAKFTIAKNIVWSTDFTYNFNSQIDPSLNQHIFLFGSSLAYKLLKNRNLEAKLTVFDILGQNQNISRNVNNMNITDNRTNALQRYGLFTLTYSMKKVQGRDPEKNNAGFYNMMRPKDD